MNGDPTVLDLLEEVRPTFKLTTNNLYLTAAYIGNATPATTGYVWLYFDPSAGGGDWVEGNEGAALPKILQVERSTDRRGDDLKDIVIITVEADQPVICKTDRVGGFPIEGGGNPDRSEKLAQSLLIALSVALARPR